MYENDTKNKKFLNSKVNKLRFKIHYMYIDWEGHDPYMPMIG